MHPHPRAEGLLPSVLAEVLPPDREAGLLATTLREVARLRRHRELRKQGAIVATLAVVLALSARQWHRQPTTPPVPPASSATLTVSAADAVPVITSRPLPASLVVETQSGLTPLVESDAASRGWVETADELPRATPLTDDGLLALLAGHPAALVRSGGETRLVLAAYP